MPHTKLVTLLNMPITPFFEARQARNFMKHAKHVSAPIS